MRAVGDSFARKFNLCPKTKIMVGYGRTAMPQRDALGILIRNVYRTPANKAGRLSFGVDNTAILISLAAD